jgi:hypothetical protein
MPSHHNGYMVRHILLDIAQETGSQNGDASKGDTDIVYPFVSLGVCNLASLDHHLIGSFVASNPRDCSQLAYQRVTREMNCLGDQRHIGDVELCHHYTADVLRRCRDKFRNKDVVVDGVADTAAYNANREGKGRDSGNKILGKANVSQAHSLL